MQKGQWIIRPKLHVSWHLTMLTYLVFICMFFERYVIKVWQTQVLGHLLLQIRSYRSVSDIGTNWRNCLECFWFFMISTIRMKPKEKTHDSFIAFMTKTRWCGWRVPWPIQNVWQTFLCTCTVDMCVCSLWRHDPVGTVLRGHQAFNKQRRWCIQMTKLRRPRLHLTYLQTWLYSCWWFSASCFLVSWVQGDEHALENYRVPRSKHCIYSLQFVDVFLVFSVWHDLVDLGVQLPRLNETAARRAMWGDPATLAGKNTNTCAHVTITININH